ncbi:MAG: hypothetical protein ACXWE5_10840, partial [Actinomycetota bacterium]
MPAFVRTVTVCRAVHRASLCAALASLGGILLPDQLVPVRDRVSFAKLDEVLPLPDLVGIQRESFDWLLNEGLKEVLEEVSPIEDFTEQFQLYFGKHQFKDVKATEEECRDRDITYSQPLFVEATFVNKVTGEIKEQEVFMGDFPIMTGR